MVRRGGSNPQPLDCRSIVLDRTLVRAIDWQYTNNTNNLGLLEVLHYTALKELDFCILLQVIG